MLNIILLFNKQIINSVPGPSSGTVVRSACDPVIGNDYKIPEDPEVNEFDRFIARLEKLKETLCELLLESEMEVRF